ncbi:hypothetical protein DD238_002407 [Peronospora effusa]|uniref:Aldehyde dehydrogenase domain-containing protein n=2 Tax=Peronospora effusa TaxID=542832 RepID=A0A3M6VKG9_9STRA|nr:hypothetical protein DD238_002407 [Peronospora effusa]
MPRRFSSQVFVKQTNLLINGQFVPSISGKTFKTYNPATEEKIADVAEAGSSDIDAAVAVARAAFKGSWRTLPAADRGRLLNKLADLFEEKIDELAVFKAVDNGKPCAEAKGADFGPLCSRLTVTMLDGPKRFVALLSRSQDLHCAIPSPSLSLGPALAAGNIIVLKLGEQTPLSALRVGELIVEAGVVNIVPGVAGPYLAQHPNVDKVAFFTGSTEVGYQIMRESHVNNIKRVTLELGGKSANIILEEIFGPVMSVFKFKTIDQVIERANDSVYGLRAGVVTKSIDNAIKISNGIQTGTAYGNGYSVCERLRRF